MNMKLGVYITVCALLLIGSGAGAITPEDKCEADKNKIAGKYAFCRQKAEAKAILKGEAPDYSKCDDKYGFKWALAESTAGMGVCPSEGDETAIQSFITQHSDDLAGALAGGPLPDCPGDLTTCNGTLATCNTNLTATTASLTTCIGSLSTCNTSLSTCTSSLTTVNAGTAAQGDVLSGKTFSSSAGIGVAGAMTNVGQQNVMPGTGAATIMQGYHDGTGTVAGDADLVAGNIKDGVSIFGVTGTLVAGAGSQPLRTGQTQCDQGAGTLGACPGSPAGQDASALKGATRSYTDNGDGTITDNKTGLMWEKLSDDGTIHDKDNTYTWYTAFTSKIATLNGGVGFAGYTDWRLPNVNELQGLADYGRVNPSIDPAFNTSCAASCTVLTCSCTRNLAYWSSTTFAGGPTTAWYVNFFDGTANTNNKSFNPYVRAVRGGL